MTRRGGEVIKSWQSRFLQEFSLTLSISQLGRNPLDNLSRSVWTGSDSVEMLESWWGVAKSTLEFQVKWKMEVWTLSTLIITWPSLKAQMKHHAQNVVSIAGSMSTAISAIFYHFWSVWEVLLIPAMFDDNQLYSHATASKNKMTECLF